MENILKAILGFLLIILGIIWYNHERKKFIADRKNQEYWSMTFSIKFMVGAFLLFTIGIRLIYDAF